MLLCLSLRLAGECLPLKARNSVDRSPGPRPFHRPNLWMTSSVATSRRSLHLGHLAVEKVSLVATPFLEAGS